MAPASEGGALLPCFYQISAELAAVLRLYATPGTAYDLLCHRNAG